MSGCVALVVAAGRGQRFGGDIPKQYRMLGGQAVLRHALAAFAGHAEVDAVAAVIHPDDDARLREAAAGLDLLEPVVGGPTRQDSVRLGLESLEERVPERVLIHDGARPFIDAGVVSRTIAALETAAGVVPAVPVSDTLKRGAEGRVTATLERRDLWRGADAPGLPFCRHPSGASPLRRRRAHRRRGHCRAGGLSVALVAGSEDNVKVTTEDDLERAERLLGGDVRTGLGFDVHRFGAGSRLMLCGVEVPFERGLTGHSDADVGLHALTDAILGAVGAGDIGSHFAPADPRWRDAPSDGFLRRAAELVATAGGAISGVDVTIVCEQPRIGPFRAAMVRRIAGILAVPEARVSVKATTTEGLGFTGRGEGIAAQAVATVRFRASP